MLTLLLVLCASAEPKSKLVVLELQGAGGLDATTVSAFTDTLTTEVAAAGHFDVVSSNDVRTLLGVERQRQLMGCGESSCYTELAGALGSRYVMSGTLAKLGELFELNLQVIDTQSAKPLGRASHAASSLEGLRALLPYTVADATKTARPEAPSAAVPVVLMSVGGVSLGTGVVLGVIALSSEAALTNELAQPSSEGQPLGSGLTTYQARADGIGAQKSASIATMIAGATLVAVGIILFPKGPKPPPLALVPNGPGLSVVGVFP